MSPRLKAPPSWSLNEDSGVIARSALVLLLSVMVAVVVRDDFWLPVIASG